MRNIYKVLFTVILSITSLLMLSTEQLFSQTTFVVGTATTSSYPSPFCNLYKNSWHEMIFTPNELSAGAGCTLNSIAFQSASTSTLTATTLKIYIGERTTANHSSTTDWTPMSNLTLVYSGNNVTIGTGSTGTWQTFNFNTPYDYSGANNLVVVVTKTASSYLSSCTWYYSTATVTNPGLYRQSDSDATYGTTHPGTNTGTQYAYRANTRFTFGSCCTARPGNFSFSTTSASVIAPATIDLAQYLTNTTGQTNLTWTSDNTSVATVTNNGVVSALAEGTAIITVTYPASGSYCGGRATFTVNVSDGCPVIGTGTSCSYTYGPVNNYYKYSYRQIIYSASDLVQGTIRSISFKYCYTTAMTKKTSVNIYMGHTNKTSFTSSTDWIAIGSMQLVYSGSVNATAQGWSTITLTNPFEYDGISNLVVAIDDNSGQFDGSSYTYYYTAGTGTTTIYTHSDTENTNPASPSSGSTSSNFPNTKFCIDACTQRPGNFLFSPASTSVVYPATVDVAQYLTNTTGQTVTWSSSNPAVASVNNSGVATAIAEGTAVITATFPSTSEYCAGVAQFTINVSDGCPIVGTETNCNYEYAPVNEFYNYGYRQIIYPASNFFPGIIRSIAFQYCYTAAMTKKTNVNIYMGTTNKTAFTSTSDWISINTMQLVYSGPLNATAQGWHNINLTNEFEYNGVGNIVIAIDDNSGQYDGISYTFDYSSASGNVMIYYYSDGTNPDPASPTTASGITSYFPNTKFCIESCDGPTPEVTFAQGVLTTSCTGTVSQTPILSLPSTGTVTYTSSNPYLATVDPNTGVVTPTGNGTGQVIITANVTSDANYCYTSGTYIVNITPGSSIHSLIYNTTAACAGTATPANIAGTTGTVAFVTNTTPSCTSAQFFTGWNTAADGSGTAYYSGDEVNIGCYDVTLYAQYDDINYCRAAIPFCTDQGDSQTYTASTTQQNAIDFANGGSNIGCLYSTPSPTWFYMRMDRDGDMLIYIENIGNDGSGHDVDFACWGPFDAMTMEQLMAENCTDNLSISSASGTTPSSHRPTNGEHYTGGTYELGDYPMGNMVDCSYNSASTEWCYIHDAQEGEWYIFLITNYSRVAGTITFTSESLGSNPATQANTDCTIVPCGINGITTTVGECDPATNTYTITGFVYFEEAPTSGTLVVKVEEGNTPITYTINRPFNSPAAFTLTGLTPDDLDHLVIAEFTATDCSRTASFHAPASCDETTFNQLGPYCVGETPDALPTTSLEGIIGTWSPATISTATAGTTTYTFTPTGGTSHTTMDIVVNANPTITIGTPATLTCATTSVNLTATSTGTTYSWSNGGSAATTTVSAQGTYTVTVSDANGCSNTASVTVNQDISQPTVSITNNTGATQLTCLLESINVTAAGSGVSYAWSNGITTAANTITAPGTYTVTSTGSNGCTNTASITITESSDRPTVSITNNTGTTTLNCNTTSISLTATGSGNSYSWSTGSHNAGITVNTVGTYTVTTTATNGCTNSTSITINNDVTPPTVNINTPQPLTCNTTSQTLTVNTNANTYVWSTGATTQSINVTAPNTYNVIVTGANGCTSSASVVVSQDIATPTLTLNTPQTLTCNVTTQQLTATTNANTYAWSTGATTQSITVNTPNTYVVTVIGTNGCTTTGSVVVSQDITTPTVNITNITGTTILTCTLESISLNATGSGVSYMWSNGTATAANTITSAGTYSVTSTGSNGCTSQTSITITESSDRPTVSINTPQTLTCALTTQQLTVTTNAPTFVWSTNATTNSINVTNPGTYSVTATGANGCTNTASVTVNQNITAPTLSLNTPQTLTCTTTSQQLTATTNANTYAWSTGATTQSINVTTPNTYTVTVTGTNGCTSTASVVVNQNIVTPTLTLSQPQVLTCATPSQTITATTNVTTYAWSTGANSQSITVTSPNTYSVTVTGTNGCTSTASVVVTQNVDIPTLSINQPQTLTCNTLAQTLTATTNANTYSWSTGSNTPSINVTNPGTYTVTVTGTNGCINTASVVVNQDIVNPTLSLNTPQPLTCAVTSQNLTATTNANSYIWTTGETTQTITVTTPNTYVVTVTGTNGCTTSASVVVTQNSVPPTVSINQPQTLTCSTPVQTLTATSSANIYSWTTGATAQSINVTTPNTYGVTVTATNGCTASASVTVSQNIDTPLLSITNNTGATELTCLLGSISVVATGNAASYSWSNNLGTNASQSLTMPGTYTVTATGSNGCTSSQQIVITESADRPTVAVNNNSGTYQLTCNTTSISVTATGTGNSYIWSNGVATANNTFTQPGTYTVTATATNGCTNATNVIISQDINPPTLSITNNTGTTELTCAVTNISLSGTGTGVSYSWSNGTNTAMTNITVPGTYTLTSTALNGCTSSTSIVITQNVVPPTVTLNNNTGVTELDCRNTSISVSANGGVSYVWSNGTIGNENTFTAPGTYIVTVTADNGCTNTNSITLTQATPLTASIVSVGEIACNGGNTSVTVSANGGTPNYIYTWSNGQSSSTATGLVAGSYSVTINDMGGCSQVLNVVLTQPDPVRLTLTPINIQCGNTLGAISANVTGGVQPYTYNWSNGVASQNNTRLYRGSYTVTVNDAHGCQQTATASIDLEGSILVDVNIVSPISCSNTADGSLTATSSNGAAPFSYHWSTNDVSSTVSNLAPGSYTVTMSDDWGCMGIGRNTLDTPEPIKINTATVPTKCYDTNDGSIALTITGGNTPFTFAWNNPLAQGQNPTGLSVGQYIVTITDATNCTATATTTITAPEEMFLDVQTRDISCFGDANGVVTIATTGGNAPYSYSITTEEGVIHTSSYSKFSAGSYEIVVTDYNGCSKQDMAVITEPPAISGNVILSNPTCYDARDGQIEFSITGGVEPYTFIYNTYYTDNPIITGLIESVYEVSVTDANGCLYKMDDALLRDTPVDCIWIPNVFTPNGDGVNDEWIIEHIENFPEADIYVYNRWGQPLYQAKGSEESWNGTYKGHFVPAGCYMYIIDLHTNHEVYSGIVTIVY